MPLPEKTTEDSVQPEIKIRKCPRFDKKHIAFKTLALLKSITDASDRPIHGYVNCSDGKVVATDSKRLTICNAELLDAEDGLYEIIKHKGGFILLPAESEDKFPDTQRVSTKEHVVESHDIRKTCSFSLFVADILQISSFKISVFIDFLEDIYPTTSECITVHYQSEKYPIIIESDNLTHVIMPMSR